MSSIPREIVDRFGAFRAAWRLSSMNGYITRERVVGSDWYIFCLKLEGRWEYLPFGTVEAGDDVGWESIIGPIEVVAGAIGHSQLLYVMVERDTSSVGDEVWYWLIYWKRGGGKYLLTVQ
jgi:hypothetical protein